MAYPWRTSKRDSCILRPYRPLSGHSTSTFYYTARLKMMLPMRITGVVFIGVLFSPISYVGTVLFPVGFLLLILSAQPSAKCTVRGLVSEGGSCTPAHFQTHAVLFKVSKQNSYFF